MCIPAAFAQVQTTALQPALDQARRAIAAHDWITAERDLRGLLLLDRDCAEIRFLLGYTCFTRAAQRTLSRNIPRAPP